MQISSTPSNSRNLYFKLYCPKIPEDNYIILTRFHGWNPCNPWKIEMFVLSTHLKGVFYLQFWKFEMYNKVAWLQSICKEKTYVMQIPFKLTTFFSALVAEQSIFMIGNKKCPHQTIGHIGLYRKKDTAINLWLLIFSF